MEVMILYYDGTFVKACCGAASVITAGARPLLTMVSPFSLRISNLPWDRPMGLAKPRLEALGRNMTYSSPAVNRGTP